LNYRLLKINVLGFNRNQIIRFWWSTPNSFLTDNGVITIKLAISNKIIIQIQWAAENFTCFVLNSNIS